MTISGNCTTGSFHDFNSQNFKLSVSNPKSKHAAHVSVLSRISNCQGEIIWNSENFWIIYNLKFNFWIIYNLNFWKLTVIIVRTTWTATTPRWKSWATEPRTSDISVCASIDIYIYLSIYLSFYLSFYLYLSLYIYIYTHVCISLSLYIYIYIYIQVSWAASGTRRPQPSKCGKFKYV